jgi:hypothetical protein
MHPVDTPSRRTQRSQLQRDIQRIETPVNSLLLDQRRLHTVVPIKQQDT